MSARSGAYSAATSLRGGVRTTGARSAAFERRGAPLLRDRAVERGPLLRRRGRSSGSAPPSPRAETPAPCSVPAAREMLSFISVPPRSLAPALQAGRGALGAHLHPGGLDVGDVRMQHQPRRPHASAPPRGRSGPCAPRPCRYDRRFHVHERQRHEFGEAAGLAPAGRAARSRCRAQCTGLLDMAEHDRGGRAQADAVRGRA